MAANVSVIPYILQHELRSSDSAMAQRIGQPKSTKRNGQPDWQEFYKNGPPSEVIVLSDDEDERIVPFQETDQAHLLLPQSSQQSAVNPRPLSRHLLETPKVNINLKVSPDINKESKNDDEEVIYTGSAPSSVRQSFVVSSTHSNKRKRNAATSLNNGTAIDQRIPTSSQISSLRKSQTHDSSPISSPHGYHRKRRRVSEIAYQPPPLPVRKCTDLPPQYIKEVQESHPFKEPNRDKDGYMEMKLPCRIVDNRFEITKILGQGTFGKVFAAYDSHNHRYCAVKVIRAIPKYREASKTELRVLLTIKRYDPQNIYRCIHVRESFMYRGHMCIVTDLLAMSVYDFLRSNHFLAFPASHVQSFARQMLLSVCFLHDLGLVHTDLKPENILLKDASYNTGESVDIDDRQIQRRYLKDTQINLIDFGSAIFNDEYHHGVVSTRHYRAPEILLGIGWSFPCDIWSIACILVELCIGDALFHTHDNLEHLALMEQILNKRIDNHLLHKATQNTTGRVLVNKKTMRINFPNSTTTKPSRKVVESTRKLTTVLEEAIPFMPGANPRYWSLFQDLLNKMFIYDPEERITAREALQHEWLTCDVYDDM